MLGAAVSAGGRPQAKQERIRTAIPTHRKTISCLTLLPLIALFQFRGSSIALPIQQIWYDDAMTITTPIISRWIDGYYYASHQCQRPPV